MNSLALTFLALLMTIRSAAGASPEFRVELSRMRR